jgi:hypothetical protein
LGVNQPDQMDDRKVWVAVAAEVSHLGITPFEAKALYVFALMRQLAEAAILCLKTEAAMLCLKTEMELPGYVLLADAVEVLGRCLTGGQGAADSSKARLTAGFKHLEDLEGGELLGTIRRYTVEDCCALRNFVAHGGSTLKTPVELDRQLTRRLVIAYGKALTGYWTRLGPNGSAAEREAFARAHISPLFVGSDPIFVAAMHRIMSKSGATAGQGIHI